MRIRVPLLRILLQQAAPLTLAALPIACLYVLLIPRPLQSGDGWAALFVFGHSYSLVLLLGRPATRHFAFLYSRGYSRSVLWSHMMLASAISVLVVWLPAALIVWTPLRTVFQDAVFRSPYFPIMAPLETLTPLAWLGWYAVLLPPFHYEWIRWTQPTRGPFGATLLQAAIVLGLYPLIVTSRWPSCSLIWTAAAVIALTMLIVGRRLHQRLEVQA